MIDYGTRHTDLALKRLEARLRAVYRQAEKDIAAKTEDYWKRHAARDEKYRQQVADGKLSKEDYEAWQRGQVFQGKQWESKRQSVEDTLYNADSTALQMINDGKMDVFTAGANYMGYELEQHGRIDTGFNLYDGPTVTRLLKDDPQILPKARIKKEKAYVWYNKLVNNCVLQGIIQGESIGEIAERIGKTTGERTRTAMLRNARTAYTGAQNAGRLEGMRQAEKLGVNVKKRWMATLDARTRDAHADLDGQVQDRDKPFKSPLGDIMFPGDPTAKPGLVYNCRCTITYVYPEYASTMTRRDNESGEVVGDMTYREWEAMKQGGGQAIPIPAAPAVNYKSISPGDVRTIFGERPDRALRKTDREEYDRQREAYSQSAYGIWNDGLSTDESLSIGDYSSDTYSAINGYCRGEMTEKMVRKWDVSSRLPIEQEISHIENAINRFDLQDNIKVFRTCETDVLESMGGIGSAFKDNGFVSTTIYDKSVASGTVDIVINVPKGTGRGAWIQPLSGSPDENEFLLQRGSVFEVTGITKHDNGRTTVEMTWIGVDADEPKYATREHVVELWKKRGIYDEASAKEI